MDAEQPAGIDFISQPWEDLLDELVGAAREHLILVAPFIKKHPLQRISKLLSELPSGSRPQITILTNLDWNSLLQDTLEISALVEFVEQVQTVSVYSLSSLHAKIYLADQNKAIVTSANLTSRGLRSNTEYGVIIRDPGMVNRVYQDVTSFLEKSEPITFEELQKICKEIVEHPNYHPIHIPIVEREVTPTAITQEPAVEYPEYVEQDENSHILTEEEKEYFKAVDDKDWIRVFEFEAGPLQSLSKEDTIKLAQSIRVGDQQARKTLFNGRLGKVIELANDRLHEGLTILDLIQEGAIGLWKSADEFDLDKGRNFHSFSNRSINWHIDRAIENSSRTIRLPIHFGEKLDLLCKIQHHLTQEKGLEETNMEQFSALIDSDLPSFIDSVPSIFVHPNLPTSHISTIWSIRKILLCAIPPLDIDSSIEEETDYNDGIQFSNTPIMDSEDEYQHDTLIRLIDILDPYGNYIPHLPQYRKQLLDSTETLCAHEFGLFDLIVDVEIDVEMITESLLMKRDLHSALSNLPEREACILRMRFGLNEDIQVFTLKELGERLKVTRERVRQIEIQALTRLRNSSAATDLRAYHNA